MNEEERLSVVRAICEKDGRYDMEAYFFIWEALAFTAKSLEKPADGPARQVRCGELLEGLRLFALQEFGPMSLTVLKAWGITKTEDFGEIVFNLVDSGTWGRTDDDRREHFANGYDFFEAFGRPFLPQNAVAGTTGAKRPVRKRTRAKAEGDTPDA